MKKTIKKINRRLNIPEKVVVKLFPKTTYKIYRMGVKDALEWASKQLMNIKMFTNVEKSSIIP